MTLPGMGSTSVSLSTVNLGDQSVSYTWVGFAVVLIVPAVVPLFHSFAAALNEALGFPFDWRLGSNGPNLPALSTLQPHVIEPIYVPACLPSTASAAVSRVCPELLPRPGWCARSFNFATSCFTTPASLKKRANCPPLGSMGVSPSLAPALGT